MTQQQQHDTDPRTGREMSRSVIAAATVTVVLWASAFIGIRGAGPYFDPGAMALLRMVVGSAALGAYAFWRGVRWPARRDFPLLAGWGVAWFCGYNLALNTAERMVDAGTAAMVVNLAPMIVVALAGLVLHEGYPRGLLVGAPLSFLGVVIIGSQSSGRLGVTGLLLTLLAACLYAGCTIVQKHLLKTVDSTTLTWLGTVAGVIALLPWARILVHDVQSAPTSAIAAVVYLGLFPTALAFTTWAYVLTRVSAGQTSATTYITPAVALILSWALLGETPTLLKLAGGALCLIGVFTTRALDRPIKHARQKPRSGRDGASRSTGE